MAVAWDAQQSTTTTATATSASLTLTIGGGVTNGAVIVAAHFYTNAGTVTAPTVGGNSTTAITGADTGTGQYPRTVLYGILTGSTTGAQTVSISWGTATSCIIGAMSFSGVDQSSIANAFQNGNKAGATNSVGPAVVTITSSSSSSIIATCAIGYNNSSLTSPTTQTQRYSNNDNHSGEGFNINGAGGTEAGNGSSRTHQWTYQNGSSANWWAIAGAELMPAASVTVAQMSAARGNFPYIILSPDEIIGY